MAQDFYFIVILLHWIALSSFTRMNYFYIHNFKLLLILFSLGVDITGQYPA